jgi:hypothetical protein
MRGFWEVFLISFLLVATSGRALARSVSVQPPVGRRTESVVSVDSTHLAADCVKVAKGKRRRVPELYLNPVLLDANAPVLPELSQGRVLFPGPSPLLSFEPESQSRPPC